MTEEPEGDDSNDCDRRTFLAVLSLTLGGIAGCSSPFDGDVTSTPTAVSFGDESTEVTTPSSTSIDEEHNGIKPAADHPRYWEYGGSPVVLIGGTEDDNLFQWPEPELQNQLYRLASLGGNFVRNTMSDRNSDNIYAFVDAGSGYDLTQFNSTYFDKLDTFLMETSNRDIIVSLELWDPWDLDSDDWDAHPWNPANNVNYSASNTTLETTWDPTPLQDPNPFFRTVPSMNDDSTVLQYQEAFIQRVLNVALQYDNVIYIIHNERRVAVDWANYWAQFVHDTAANAGKGVYVADMNDDSSHGSVQTTLEHNWFDFADVSQHSEVDGENHYELVADSWDQLSTDPVPLNSVKLYDCKDEGAARLWRCIFAGQAAARYHRGPDLSCKWGLGLNPRARAHIESLRIITDRIDVSNADPHPVVNHLLSNRDTDEVYMMADPGRIYGLYFPESGSVNLDVSDVNGDVQIEWRNIEAREWHSTEVLPGSEIRVETPYHGTLVRKALHSGHWAALISPDRE